jgi:hypothetical protein
VNTEAVAWLVIHAINGLYQDDQEEGCCPKCCGPCLALKLLLDDGQLDDAVRIHADGYDWWDERVGMVKRSLFDNGWRMTACHQPLA